MSFQCEKIQENINIQSKYSNIFSENIELVTIKNIVDIHNTREEYLGQRMVTWTNKHEKTASQKATVRPLAAAEIQFCCIFDVIFNNNNNA